MNHYVLTALTLLTLAGCGSMGAYDGDRRFLGVIERSQKINRAGEPSGLQMGLGAVGGLLHSAASGPTPTNLYVVLVAGETFTVQDDNEWTSGTCVEIIPIRDAIVGRSYSYGQARIVRSDKCSGQKTEAPK